MRILILLVLSVTANMLFAQTSADLQRWQQRAKSVTIIRDHYGVPHIYGKKDADCVFALMYAQCEEDFKRVEENYLTMLGRTAETEGAKNIYEDLLIRLTIDSAGAREDYRKAEPWLKELLQAWADGINFFLYKHPQVKPQLLKTFEPWFPLTYTDGSISAIQTGGLEAPDLEAFYKGQDMAVNAHRFMPKEDKLIGSNGFAVAPSKSKSGNALFFINPHVTFYFRPEVHMQSEEGLHVYGAVTWGQFFVYQGFNEHLGFMHTSSEADAADLYAEEVRKNVSGKYEYKYNGKWLPVKESKVNIRFRDGEQVKSRSFTTYATHHGPVMASDNGKWLSLRTMNRSLAGLVQSWQRTKATSLSSFQKNLDLRANLSNNTVYADNKGNIAYWHGNYMPRRDASYSWDKPVDGTTGKTEWQGMHTVSELVKVINPANGWIQNTNNTPYSVSGPLSPVKKNYPSYMAPDGENFRGLNAVRLFSSAGKLDLDDLIALGYDPKLTAFDSSLPALFDAYERIRERDAQLYAALAEPMAILKVWDRNSSETSLATTLAIHWAEKMNVLLRAEDPELFRDFVTRYGQVLRTSDPLKVVGALKEVTDDLAKRFGTYKLPWGEINRMQRIASSIRPIHSDTATSYPVGRAASTWGQLASFVSRTYYTNKRYGSGGNSFVCAVEFGPRIRARSILAGGQSGDPTSPHFFDQGKMYAEGKFKDVLFYKEDVLRNAVRTYHPGE